MKHNNTSGDTNDFNASVIYLALNAIFNSGPTTGLVGITSSIALPISVEEELTSITWSLRMLNLITLYYSLYQQYQLDI